MVAGCAPLVRRMVSSSRFHSMTMSPEKRACSAARAACPAVGLDEAPAIAGTVAMAEMAPTRAARVLFMLFLLVRGVDAVRRDSSAAIEQRCCDPTVDVAACQSAIGHALQGRVAFVPLADASLSAPPFRLGVRGDHDGEGERVLVCDRFTE